MIPQQRKKWLSPDSSFGRVSVLTAKTLMQEKFCFCGISVSVLSHVPRFAVAVLAVLKVFSASMFSNRRNFETESDFKRSINLISAFLSYLVPFQSYRGLKKLERSILLRPLILGFKPAATYCLVAITATVLRSTVKTKHPF